MEYISSFTYCDTIQTEITQNGPRPQIVNPLQVLALVAIPGNYSFAISCNIAGFNITSKNIVRLEFVAPSGTVIYDTKDIELPISKENIKTEKPAAMQFNLDMRNLVIREPGLYTTKVSVNNKIIGEYKIEVIVGE